MTTPRAILLFLSGISVSLMCSCGTTGYSVTPKPNSFTRSVFNDGRQTLISSKRSQVTVAPSSSSLRSGTNDDFIVFFKNRSGKDQLVSPSNVTASYTSSSGESSSVAVYSYDDLVKRERRRQAWAGAAAALGAAGDSLAANNAGYSNTYGSYSGYGSTSYGSSYNSHGSYSSTTYDYGAANAARLATDAKRDREFDRIATQGRANLSALANTSLKKQTLPNGRSYGGVVQMKMPRFQESGVLMLSVRIGVEVHRFTFDVSKPSR